MKKKQSGLVKKLKQTKKSPCKKTPVRVPAGKPTRWHKDKSKYNRKKDRIKMRKEKYDDLQ